MDATTKKVAKGGGTNHKMAAMGDNYRMLGAVL